MLMLGHFIQYVLRTFVLCLIIVYGISSLYAQTTIDAEQFCNRSLMVRLAVLEQVSRSSATCDPETETYETNLTSSQLSGIQKLDLRGGLEIDGEHHYYTLIKPGDFDGLTGVKTIWCEECFFEDKLLQVLPDAPSWFLAQLETLGIQNIDLLELMPEDFFKGLSNLRALSVERNNMTYEVPPGNPNRPQNTRLGEYINPEVWKHLPNLRELDIGSNRILTLPRGFFRHLKKLEILDMFDMWYEYHPYGFGSQALPAGIFEGLTNLKKLDLGYNALGAEDIADGLFDGLTSIQEIDLRRNPLLETLPRGVLNLPSGVRILTDPGVTWPEQDKPTFSIFAHSESETEGNTVSFIVDREGDTSTSQTVNFSVTETGSMLTSSNPVSTTFRGNETSKSIHVFTEDDSVDEADSTVTVTLTEDDAYDIRVSSASTVVQDNDTTPSTSGGGNDDGGSSGGSSGGGNDDGGSSGGGSSGGGSGGGGGGGSSNKPPEVIRPAVDLVLKAGESSEVDATYHLRDPERRQLTFIAECEDSSVVEVSVEDSMVTVQAMRPGITTVTITGADYRDEAGSISFNVTVHGDNQVFFFPSTADSMTRQGFVRVINHSDESGEVMITAIDDSGVEKDPITLSISANSIAHFNSDDLEMGNVDKGLSGGVDTGEGDWRLQLESDLVIETLSYVRTTDGFVTTMHEVVPYSDYVSNEEVSKEDQDLYKHVVIFNPASNMNQVSILRLINTTAEIAQVSITGVDDEGMSPGSVVRLSIPANSVSMLTSEDLESGTGEGIVSGALEDGVIKWQLFIESDQPLIAMSLLESPTGHISNLSSVPRILEKSEDGEEEDNDEDKTDYLAPLFPASADAKGRQGFLRVINNSEEEASVSITAHNNTDWEYEPLTLSVGANKTQQFNSDDLELGNIEKGLTGSTGTGEGDWRLELSSEQDISVLAYIRAPGGFLTSIHDLVAGYEEGTYHRVAIFNPGSNEAQVSILRVMNLNGEPAEVVISGVDDLGSSPGTDVSFTVPAGKVRTIKASELESGEREFSGTETGFGDEALEGALGDGIGKWQLTVESNIPVKVMSVLENPTGHLTNLSTIPY